MILSLVRHAETVVDPARDPAQWPMSDKGRRDARRLALESRWKKVARLVSSSEPKAVQTARPIAESAGVVLETCPGLDEVKRPTFRNDYVHRVQEFSRLRAKSGDDWETADEALARVQAVIRSLDNDSGEGHVVLVGHGVLWALARAWLLGQDKVDLREWRAVLMPGVSVWNLTPTGTMLLSDFEGISADTNGIIGGQSPCA